MHLSVVKSSMCKSLPTMTQSTHFTYPEKKWQRTFIRYSTTKHFFLSFSIPIRLLWNRPCKDVVLSIATCKNQYHGDMISFTCFEYNQRDLSESSQLKKKKIRINKRQPFHNKKKTGVRLSSTVSLYSVRQSITPRLYVRLENSGDALFVYVCVCLAHLFFTVRIWLRFSYFLCTRNVV